MYTFDAIILEKNIIREKHIRLIILSKDYGKITVWYYKHLTGVDIGDIARFVVRRDNTINIAKNIETKHCLLVKQWKYDTLVAFLQVLKIMKCCLVQDDMASRIFADYELIMKEKTLGISVNFCELLEMRIFKYLGSLNPDFFQNDAVLKYVYKNITQTPLERIMSAKALKGTQRDIIVKSNLFSFSTFF